MRGTYIQLDTSTRIFAKLNEVFQVYYVKLKSSTTSWTLSRPHYQLPHLSVPLLVIRLLLIDSYLRAEKAEQVRLSATLSAFAINFSLALNEH